MGGVGEGGRSSRPVARARLGEGVQRGCAVGGGGQQRLAAALGGCVERLPAPGDRHAPRRGLGQRVLNSRVAAAGAAGGAAASGGGAGGAEAASGWPARPKSRRRRRRREQQQRRERGAVHVARGSGGRTGKVTARVRLCVCSAQPYSTCRAWRPRGRSSTSSSRGRTRRAPTRGGDVESGDLTSSDEFLREKKVAFLLNPHQFPTRPGGSAGGTGRCWARPLAAERTSGVMLGSVRRRLATSALRAASPLAAAALPPRSLPCPPRWLGSSSGGVGDSADAPAHAAAHLGGAPPPRRPPPPAAPAVPPPYVWLGRVSGPFVPPPPAPVFAVVQAGSHQFKARLARAVVVASTSPLTRTARHATFPAGVRERPHLRGTHCGAGH